MHACWLNWQQIRSVGWRSPPSRLEAEHKASAFTQAFNSRERGLLEGWCGVATGVGMRKRRL